MWTPRKITNRTATGTQKVGDTCSVRPVSTAAEYSRITSIAKTSSISSEARRVRGRRTLVPARAGAGAAAAVTAASSRLVDLGTRLASGMSAHRVFGPGGLPDGLAAVGRPGRRYRFRGYDGRRRRLAP